MTLIINCLNLLVVVGLAWIFFDIRIRLKAQIDNTIESIEEKIKETRDFTWRMNNDLVVAREKIRYLEEVLDRGYQGWRDTLNSIAHYAALFDRQNLEIQSLGKHFVEMNSAIQDLKLCITRDWGTLSAHEEEIQSIRSVVQNLETTMCQLESTVSDLNKNPEQAR